MRRLTLMTQMERSANSSQTRDLISNSFKYGLTKGNYSSETVELTEKGEQLVKSLPPSTSEAMERAFELAIANFGSFKNLYETLKGKRVPTDAVLNDELRKEGISSEDQAKAGQIFLANARYLGLIRDVAGTEHIVSVEHALEELSEERDLGRVHKSTPTTEEPSSDERTTSTSKVRNQSNEPSVHINIQIHFDSTTTPEQIDQIFTSMARHLYGRER